MKLIHLEGGNPYSNNLIIRSIWVWYNQNVRKNTWLIAGIIIITILGIFAITVFTYEKTVPEAIKPTLEERISAITNQYQKGQITREEANKQFCNLTARSTDEQQKAIESIRIYANKPNLNVEYKCNNFSPNNPATNPTEETYLAEDTYYFIDIKTNQVLRTQIYP